MQKRNERATSKDAGPRQQRKSLARRGCQSGRRVGGEGEGGGWGAPPRRARTLENTRRSQSAPMRPPLMSPALSAARFCAYATANRRRASAPLSLMAASTCAAAGAPLTAPAPPPRAAPGCRAPRPLEVAAPTSRPQLLGVRAGACQLPMQSGPPQQVRGASTGQGRLSRSRRLNRSGAPQQVLLTTALRALLHGRGVKHKPAGRGPLIGYPPPKPYALKARPAACGLIP